MRVGGALAGHLPCCFEDSVGASGDATSVPRARFSPSTGVPVGEPDIMIIRPKQ